MYSRMVVPLDGSCLSERVLSYVRQLGLGLSIPVTLMTVVEPPTPTIGHSLNPDAHEYESKTHLEDHAASYLEGIASDLRSAGLQVSTATPTGTPAQEIVSEAVRHPESLIAMSGHGRSGAARWWLGSVADRVLHLTNTPLLVVRSEEEGSGHGERFDKVVLPVDGSALAEQIIPHMTPIARGLGLSVDLVRVLPAWNDVFQLAAAPEFYNPSFESMAESMATQAKEEATAYLEQLKQRLLQEGIGSVEAHLLRGDPAASIIDVAGETPDRLVAMTTHGRSGVGRWVMGSVSDRVVRNSGDPVLLLRSAGEETSPGHSGAPASAD